MTEGRVFNFSAGPAMMPEPVLKRIQENIMNHIIITFHTILLNNHIYQNYYFMIHPIIYIHIQFAEIYGIK